MKIELSDDEDEKEMSSNVNQQQPPLPSYEYEPITSPPLPPVDDTDAS